MSRLQRAVWIGVFFLLSSASAFAHPEFFEAYKKDPYLRVIPADCSACHMSKTGGDARNAFGQAFDAQGANVTPLLRAQFPDRFAYPVSKVSDTLSISFSDPNNKVVVLDSGGKLTVVDVDKKSVDGKPAVMSGTPASATPTAAKWKPGGCCESCIYKTWIGDPYGRQRSGRCVLWRIRGGSANAKTNSKRWSRFLGATPLC